MKMIVLFVVAVTIAGCGRHGGLPASNTNPTTTGDAAVLGTGGMGAGGNAGTTGASAGGATSIAGSTATSGGTGDAATGSGGVIPTGGSSVSSGGTVGATTGSGGIVSSSTRVDASGGTSSTGGGSASGGSAGGSGGSPGTTGGGGSASGGSAGGGGDRGGSSTGTVGGATAGASGSTGGAAGNGGTSGAGGASCTGCQSLEQCWNGQLCVAKSVSLPAGFAIDATEVTRAQYAAWLATSPSTNGQANVCSWNASFTPDATCMATVSVCQGAECAQHPQPCVDMCDAAAYCTAVGKRLCGAIGGGPVSSTAVDLSIDIASKSQWYNACTSNGVNQFTYGDSAVWGNCNDYLSFSKTTVPVASMPECQSPIPGYAGVFDLIGNVSEWEDNCFGSAGQADMCTPRGFSFGAGAAMPMCRQYTYANRAAAYATIGFRCCVP